MSIGLKAMMDVLHTKANTRHVLGDHAAMHGAEDLTLLLVNQGLTGYIMKYTGQRYITLPPEDQVRHLTYKAL